MSTTIYNGYILNIETFKQLSEFKQRIHNLTKAQAIKDFKRDFSKEVIEVLDRINQNRALPDPTHQYTKTRSWNPVQYVQTELRTYRKLAPEDLRYNFQWIFYTIEDSNQHVKILATTYTKNRNLIKIWEKQPEVEPYPYWDNTDEPKHLSRKKWQQRKNDWDNALPTNTPISSGSMNQTFGTYELPTYLALNEIIQHQPSKKTRIKILSRAMFGDLHIQTNINKPFSMGKYVEWLNTQNNHPLNNKIIQKLQKELPNRYNVRNLDITFETKCKTDTKS